MYHLYCITFGCLNKEKKTLPTTVYKKGIHTRQYRHFQSSHLLHVKQGTVQNLYNRHFTTSQDQKELCFVAKQLSQTIRNFGIKGRPDNQSDNKHSGYPLCKECLRQI